MVGVPMLGTVALGSAEGKGARSKPGGDTVKTVLKRHSGKTVDHDARANSNVSSAFIPARRPVLLIGEILGIRR